MTISNRESLEFRAYERARAAVLQLTQATAAPTGAARPSAYWTEELDNIDYMIDASPLIIRKLRHHAFHITGIRPYDYRVKGDTRRQLFEARLQALHKLDGSSLLIPEAPVLGGFGYEIDGRLFNVDTLKFYEVLIGMDRGGVLARVRGQSRPTVCEIGAGWAGFAYQFKTLFPQTRYVIVDFPELFLFSGTYLGSVFPDATLAFCGTAETPTLADAGDADFVFVPHTRAGDLTTMALDVTVNMVSFQEMTGAQVRSYASIAAEAGCPLLYSLNRERSPYNTELVSVSEALAESYRLTEVPLLDTDYTSAMKKPPKAVKMVERSEFNYRHLVGRLERSSVRAHTGAAALLDAHRGTSGGERSAGPSVVLGMTLYNRASHLREAMDSLLGQTDDDFALVLLDDASTDGTEAIAREYETRDPRVRYVRHDARQAMIATWHEVVEIARREYPSARLFAWTSDHDRWHPRWLERLRAELDADADAVLAYPITRRIAPDGVELDKGPRLFETAGVRSYAERWTHMCHEGIGAGDMVYGLMRIDALVTAGIFRRVLRPDRLLITEMTLYGTFRQVPEVLWFRREFEGTSVGRQRHSLVLAGDEPTWFGAPPWFQHAVALWDAYARPENPPLPIARSVWARMLVRYQITYGWRHFRKTQASHAIGRGIDNVIWVKKLAKHYWHHAVYRVLVGSRTAWGRARRISRRAVYEVLMLMHRLGLRGSRKSETR
jgi:glycosyltransferase involved in cell wall biosynthesis